MAPWRGGVVPNFVSVLMPHIIGPSGVHALPLGVAAEQSVHYILLYFSFFFSSVPHTFLPEGDVLGL
jgi:hypothetical protein